MACGVSQRRQRGGFTLIELLVSVASATVLMGGLAGTLYISTKALPVDAPAAADANRSALALSQLASDVRHAQRFTERTGKALTFTVPDRSGDLVAETIRYSWSGTAGDPLLYKYNDGAAVTLLANVQDFKLSAVTRLIADAAIEDPSNLVIFESFSEAKGAIPANNLSVPAPTGVVATNLLVAAMAIDAGGGSSLAAPAGWTLVHRQDGGGQVGMGVWWKIATGAEPANYTFTWTSNRKAYGWIMRFSGAHQTLPVNVSAWASGTSATPTCPTVTTTVANALILRLGGFDDDDINVDNAGIAGYSTITVDRSDATATSTSGGAAHATLGAVGISGTAQFALTATEEYVSFTLALAPD